MLQRAFPACLLLSLLLPVMSRADNALDTVHKRGVLVIATDATYPPFEFREGVGKPHGFDVDLGDEIARELGVKSEWQVLEWAGVFGALDAGKADLVLSGVTITDERKRGMSFSRPYFLSGQTIARRRGDTRIATSKDLPGKTVAVQQQTTGQFAAEALGIPLDSIHRFDALQDALLDVRNRRADAAIGDLPALRDLLGKGYADLEIAGGIFKDENVGVAMRRDAPDLLAAVNTALSRIMADGRYAAIYERWMGEKLPSDTLARLDRVRAEGETGANTARLSSFDVMRHAFPLLLSGTKLTLILTSLTLLLGTLAGLALALGRLSGFAPLAAAVRAYVEVVRGTPLLVQIYLIYFVLPRAGVSVGAFAAGLLALTLNAAAYISEIFRAGIESIDAGQMEAARSLGMNYPQAMRWVILPQTLRRVLPPLTNEAVALLKDSSLVSVVALSELMRVGKELATNSGEPTPVLLLVALLYLAMTLPLTFLVRWLEVRWQPISRPRAKA